MYPCLGVYVCVCVCVCACALKNTGLKVRICVLEKNGRKLQKRKLQEKTKKRIKKSVFMYVWICATLYVMCACMLFFFSVYTHTCTHRVLAAQLQRAARQVLCRSHHHHAAHRGAACGCV